MATPTTLHLLGKYVAHLATGAAIFATLLAFSVTLNALVQLFEPLIADRGFVQLMTTVEKFILHLDVVLTAWWAVYSTYTVMIELSNASRDK
jgi:hypothetical protein